MVKREFSEENPGKDQHLNRRFAQEQNPAKQAAKKVSNISGQSRE